MEFGRELPQQEKPEERIKNYKEFYKPFAEENTLKQAARCMDCGVPFCHSGCPLGNNIPEFNDAVYEQNWGLAYDILNSTNNFPEFTGRICPAPCEGSCVLGINKDPVAIEHIEKSIIEKAFELDLVKPIEVEESGKSVAIVGSGPAGLAAAMQLRTAGHAVSVYERAAKPGGLLRYGIPDFKLEKWVVERRIKLMEESGITFICNTNIGVDISVETLQTDFDALVLAGGSTIPRDLPIPGRELEGIYPAMEFLTRQNQKVSGEWTQETGEISAKGKHVVVIGGGDTGSDCVGTSNRHGATSITQIELLSKPPASRTEDNPWPLWPMVLRTSSSHEEGCERAWAILSKEFIGGEQGQVKALRTVEIEWKPGRRDFKEIPGTEKEIPCDLALLAVGFLHPQKEGMIEQLGLELDKRGNVLAKNYHTSVEGVFSAGDMRRGQSLVVWAISEGREAARAVDSFLSEGNTSKLPSKEVSLTSLA